MDASKFTYGRSVTRGLTWYCQVPGALWATAPHIGWDLMKTSSGTWALVRPGVPQVDIGTRKLGAAMAIVAHWRNTWKV